MSTQTSMIWLALPTSDIISHFCHLSRHLYCQTPYTAPVQGVDTTNRFCCSQVSLLLYSSPNSMTLSSCFAKTQDSNSSWKGPLESSSPAPWSKQGQLLCQVVAQGLALMSFENLQGFSRVWPLSLWRIFSLCSVWTSSLAILSSCILSFNWILQGGADAVFFVTALPVLIKDSPPRPSFLQAEQAWFSPSLSQIS